MSFYNLVIMADEVSAGVVTCRTEQSTFTDKLSQVDQAIEIWRYRKLLTMLAQSRGAGTSCITLILPPSESDCCPSSSRPFVGIDSHSESQIAQASNMLTMEYGTASNIKSRVNR